MEDGREKLKRVIRGRKLLMAKVTQALAEEISNAAWREFLADVDRNLTARELDVLWSSESVKERYKKNAAQKAVDSLILVLNMKSEWESK